MEVTFDDLDGGTRMTVVQKGFPTAELRDLVGDGVSVMLDRLEGLLP
ncbi:MAG: SRPBCC domain-containing protein [Actinomycetota bacterium]